MAKALSWNPCWTSWILKVALWHQSIPPYSSIDGARDFKNDNIESDLSSLLNVENVMLYKTILEKPLGMKAVTGLISVFRLLWSSFLGSSYDLQWDLPRKDCAIRIRFISVSLSRSTQSSYASRYMRLDRSAIQTMNLFPANSRDNKLSRYFSMFSLSC